MSKLGNLGARLHRGEVSYDFIGHRKIWYGKRAQEIVRYSMDHQVDLIVLSSHKVDADAPILPVTKVA